MVIPLGEEGNDGCVPYGQYIDLSILQGLLFRKQQTKSPGVKQCIIIPLIINHLEGTRGVKKNNRMDITRSEF